MLEGKDADFEKPVLIPDRGKFAAQLGYRTASLSVWTPEL